MQSLVTKPVELQPQASRPCHCCNGSGVVMVKTPSQGMQPTDCPACRKAQTQLTTK
jgi:hypothetical protein